MGLKGLKIQKVAAGSEHMGVLTKEGKVYTWGYNANGQLGHGLRNVFPEPVEIPLGDPVVKARCGWQCTVYLTESARPLVCGGIKAEGPSVADMPMPGADGDGADAAPAPELAGGGARPEASVVDMGAAGMSVFGEVVTEAGVGEAHGLLVCYDGSVKGWGYNRQAQAVGDFTDDTFMKLSRVEGLPDGYKGLTVSTGG